MEVRKVDPNKFLIELNEAERAEFVKAVARMGRSFLGVPDLLKKIGADLYPLAGAVQEVVNECQRLDPAFCGPRYSVERESEEFGPRYS